MKWISTMSVTLAVLLVIFFLVKLASRLTWIELAGPYLAFSACMVITLSMSWFLNRRKLTLTPRHFAFGAALSVAFFVFTVDVAWAYLGLALGVLSWSIVSDWSNWVFIVAPLTLVASAFAYKGAYRNAIAARTLTA